jgi:hypothetical protein
MANLFLYFVFVLASFSFYIEGVSDRAYADKISYLDINSVDFDSDSNDLDAEYLLVSTIGSPFQGAKLNSFYNFSADTFAVQSFLIRAPPYFS